ncbi:MAG: HAD family hydrolase [Armatimonadota bacterium]
MMSIFCGIRAVLFDMDGTLVETSIDFSLMKREMLRIAEEYGIPSHQLANLDIIGIIDAAYRELVSQSRSSDAETMYDEAYGILQEIEISACRNAISVEGAIKLLHAIRDAGIKICIVTRNSREAVGISVERTGVFFDILLTRDDVPDVKPRPDHLISALEPFGIPPDEAVMVGDHWMDVVAGKAAGTRTVGFIRPDRPDDFFDPYCPDLVIHSLSELTDALAET